MLCSNYPSKSAEIYDRSFFFVYRFIKIRKVTLQSIGPVQKQQQQSAKKSTKTIMFSPHWHTLWFIVNYFLVVFILFHWQYAFISISIFKHQFHTETPIKNDQHQRTNMKSMRARNTDKQLQYVGNNDNRLNPTKKKIA